MNGEKSLDGILISVIQNSIWQQSYNKRHIQQMSNNCRAWHVYQAHSGEQWCRFNNTRQKWVAYIHMTHNAVKYYSGSRMDCPCWKTSCSVTSALSQTHIAPSQVLPCQHTHTPSWGYAILNTGVLCWSTVNLYHTAASGAQKQVYRNWWKIIKWTKEAVSLKCYHLMYVCVRVLDISSKISTGDADG